MRLDKPSPLIFLTQFKGCVRSVLGRTSPIVLRSHVESVRKGDVSG